MADLGLSNYSVSSYSYPADIMHDEYGGNFAMFFINVQSESKLGMPKRGSLDSGLNTLDNVTTGINTRLKNISEAKAVLNNAVTAALGGGFLGAIASMPTGGLSNALKAAAGVGSVAAALTGVAAMGSGEFSKPTKRLSTAIALHMPTSLAIRYAVSYEEVDTQMMAAVNELTSLNLGNTFQAGSAYGLKNAPESGAIQKLSKTAPNPMKEQVFRTVDFRTFQFNYRFAPRNETEASNVLNIIDQFKFHMHPEFKDQTGFLYIFPSEFDVVYYSGDQVNDKVHKHTSCVLTEVSLNYTPNGVFNTFSNGMPTQIDMTLTFKELASLDKQKIKEGGF